MRRWVKSRWMEPKGGARERGGRGGNKKSASRDAGKMSVKEGGRGKG